MTTERKLLIAAGAVLIALIIAVAAFSLGVYVGVHGWTAGAPAVAGPGQGPVQQPAAAQQPAAQNPLAAPGGQPQLVGQVRTVDGTAAGGAIVVLATPQGQRGFRVAPDALVVRLTDAGEQPASLEEVIPGQHLRVFGTFAGDGAGLLIARRLDLVPPPPAASQPATGQEGDAPAGPVVAPSPQLVGQVRAVSAGTVTLDTPQGPRLFQLADDVQVYRREQGLEQPASLEEVIPGQHLAVYGTFEGDGGRRLIAARLVLLPPPSAAAPTPAP